MIDPQGQTEPTQAEFDEAISTVIKPFVNTWLGAAWKPLNQVSTVATKLKGSWYLPGSSAASKISETSLNIAGTGADISAAASQAMVMSLLTDASGRSGRGRMYLPATAGLGVGANSYKFTDAAALAMMDATKVFIASLYTEAGQPWGVNWPSVQSLKTGSLHAITRVRVDCRPDRQENRERGIAYNVFTESIGA